jgi:hypothetical protein
MRRLRSQQLLGARRPSYADQAAVTQIKQICTPDDRVTGMAADNKHSAGPAFLGRQTGRMPGHSL